jgi:hypothetical protein
VKCTDGACKNRRMTGCVGIIRYSRGECLAYLSNLLVYICNVFVAELWKVLEERVNYIWLLVM